MKYEEGVKWDEYSEETTFKKPSLTRIKGWSGTKHFDYIPLDLVNPFPRTFIIKGNTRYCSFPVIAFIYEEAIGTTIERRNHLLLYLIHVIVSLLASINRPEFHRDDFNDITYIFYSKKIK